MPCGRDPVPSCCAGFSHRPAHIACQKGGTPCSPRQGTQVPWALLAIRCLWHFCAKLRFSPETPWQRGLPTASLRDHGFGFEPVPPITPGHIRWLGEVRRKLAVRRGFQGGSAPLAGVWGRAPVPTKPTGRAGGKNDACHPPPGELTCLVLWIRLSTRSDTRYQYAAQVTSPAGRRLHGIAGRTGTTSHRPTLDRIEGGSASKGALHGR